MRYKRTNMGDVSIELDDLGYLVKVYIIDGCAKIWRRFRHKDLAWEYFNRWEGINL
jgi:hypothetical protein